MGPHLYLQTMRISYMKRWLALLGCLVVTACGQQPLSPSLSTAIAGVQSDLRAAQVVGVPHSVDWTPAQTIRFMAVLRTLQCAQRQDDPTISVMASPYTLNLVGSFTSSGSFSPSGSTLPLSISGNANASRSKSQGLTVPVELISLSDLSTTELGRSLSKVSPAFSDKIHDVSEELAHEKYEEYVALRTVVDLTIKTYSDQQCPGKSVNHTLIGVKR